MDNYKKFFIELIGLKTIRGFYKNNTLNINLKSGDILYIKGQNGIGKTTLLKTISGIIQPLHGQIKFYNNDNLLKENEISSQSFYTGNYSLQFERVKVLNFLQCWQKYIKCDENVLKNLIKEFNIINILDSYCNEISQGEEKKVFLILNFLFNKKLMIFDEPFNGIDDCSKQILINKFTQYAKNGYIIIYTSHVENSYYNKILEIGNV